jgi:hypothetical protein
MEEMAMDTATAPNALRIRVAILGVFALLAVLFLVFVPRIPQDPAYHNFADQRTILGIPHAWNVLSNVPFLVVGVLGLGYLARPSVWRSPVLFMAPWERWAYVVLFVFVALTGFGSAYYHAEPNNDTLYWDRLPMAVVFMTFFTLILGDRVSARAAPWLWLPLVAAGVLATTYWHWTELRGAGDQRLYILVQFLPLLMIPVLLLVLPGHFWPTADVFVLLGWYVLAKVLELLDHVIWSADGQVVGGHALKHVVAALGGLWVLVILTRRAAARTPQHPLGAAE